jgi:hypothetical protein
MTQSDINKMTSDRRLRLRFWDSLNHFGIVIAFSVLPIMSVKSIYEELNGMGYGVRSISDFAVIGIIGLSLCIVFSIIQYRRLRFKSITVNLDKNDISNALTKTAKELDWYFVNGGENFAIAKRKGGFTTGSWGEQITVLFDNNEILINSICDPDKWSSIASFGRNKQNVLSLMKNLKKASTQHRV